MLIQIEETELTELQRIKASFDASIDFEKRNAKQNILSAVRERINNLVALQVNSCLRIVDNPDVHHDLSAIKTRLLEITKGL